MESPSRCQVYFDMHDRKFPVNPLLSFLFPSLFPFLFPSLRRLAVLVGVSMQFDEPALLVGETGCGKTSVCQVLSRIHSQTLRILNCHMNTETADFLGGLRPSRDNTAAASADPENQHRLFEWVDGPLIQAMKDGQHFLVDEISLADDSVSGSIVVLKRISYLVGC